MRKICIFTSTRADWGLLRGVARRIHENQDLELQILASGSHLSEQFGMTIDEINLDQLRVNERVPILEFDDSSHGVCQSMGLAMSRYSDSLSRLKPDILLVLGDRYETFCIAAVAQVHRIAVAHIHGGETTEGAVDEAFRHSITKMSVLHFPVCEEYRNRIVQLGESPAVVHDVGALGVETIRKAQLMDRPVLEESLRFHLDAPFFLVTFHPVTLESATAGEQFGNLLAALDTYPDFKILLTYANADTDGSHINQQIESYGAKQPERCLAVSSLGLQRYLSAMNLCAVVIGNSSSGILEAPAFRKPTVNIGDRQKGRVRAESVIDCASDTESIVNAIEVAIDAEFNRRIQEMSLPFEKPDTAEHIVTHLLEADLGNSIKKSFYNMPVPQLSEV